MHISYSPDVMASKQMSKFQTLHVDGPFNTLAVATFEARYEEGSITLSRLPVPAATRCHDHFEW